LHHFLWPWRNYQPSFYPSIHPLIYPSFCPDMHPFIHPSTHLSVLLSSHASIYPSMYLLVYLSACCLSIHPSICTLQDLPSAIDNYWTDKRNALFEGSSPSSAKPAKSPYPEEGQSSSHLHSLGASEIFQKWATWSINSMLSGRSAKIDFLI
jgi:hypothetical protein